MSAEEHRWVGMRKPLDLEKLSKKKLLMIGDVK